MDADGKNLTQLTDGVGPVWSPDGQRIAFSTFFHGRDGDGDIYVMDADGKNLTQLITQLIDSLDYAWQLSWSPDSQRIAFTSERSSRQVGLDMAIHVMDADGKNLTRLTDLSAWGAFPVWSPDGQRIAFESLRDGNYDIYVMDADGKNLTRLTDHPATDWHPAWSPDGQRIAFTSFRHGGEYSAIYVIYID